MSSLDDYMNKDEMIWLGNQRSWQWKEPVFSPSHVTPRGSWECRSNAQKDTQRERVNVRTIIKGQA